MSAHNRCLDLHRALESMYTRMHRIESTRRRHTKHSVREPRYRTRNAACPPRTNAMRQAKRDRGLPVGDDRLR